jgi:dipeptidyl aminopeptidase/acylaminoacyl peptidase
MLETLNSHLASALDATDGRHDARLRSPAKPETSGYCRPSQAILDVLGAPVPPLVWFSPARNCLLLLERNCYPSIAELAEPVIRLAGLRVNPQTNGPHQPARFTSFRLRRIDGGGEVAPLLPHDLRLSYPVWSPAGRHIAFINTKQDGVELLVCETATGHVRRLDGLRLNAAFGPPAEWMPDGRTLLVRLIPDDRPNVPPAAPPAPLGPNARESSGKQAPLRAYQDLLRSPHDEALFDYYATSQLAFVDVPSGRVERFGEPAIFRRAEPSPDGRLLLVSRVCRPYSRLHPQSAFPAEVEVWNTRGEVVRHLASLPLADAVPIEGVADAPREWCWRPTEDATLVWVEALDGGDPRTPAAHRDRVLMWRAPFAGAPIELARTEHRFWGLRWMERDDLALLSEYDRERLRHRTLLVETTREGGSRSRVLFSYQAQDRRHHPGAPVSRALASGHHAVLQHGDWIYLSGSRDGAKGRRPFLDRLNLRTLRKERLFTSRAGCYESFVALLRDDASRFITCRETPEAPANYLVRVRETQTTERPAASSNQTSRARGPRLSRALTSFRDTAPQLRAVSRRLVTYERADGVKLSFTLHLPPHYREGMRLPTVLWSYPVEFNDPVTAGQIAGSAGRFTTLRGASHLFFLLEGYAVLDAVSMPIVGDPETVNETFIEQITMNARAAVEEATRIGVADPERIGVGGHSYGAFMAANLLAHTDLFRAGIALSGAYNRTLTPFGFQRERRTLWEAPDTYIRVSPLMQAHRIKSPLLLIHGEEDGNVGTQPQQSERLYQAICGTGGTARLVMLPHEGHGYAARESIEHALYEMTSWFDRHLRRAP